jgi:hypothetical protein
MVVPPLIVREVTDAGSVSLSRVVVVTSVEEEGILVPLTLVLLDSAAGR